MRSPLRPDYFLKNQSFSPAFIDSSGKRPAAPNYFFNPHMMQQENTGKTSEQNVFFKFGGMGAQTPKK